MMSRMRSLALCCVPAMVGEWVQELPTMTSALISWPTP